MANNDSPTMAVSINLQPVWVDNVGYKVGINVGFAPDTEQVPFEFDTGGPGFWSAYKATGPHQTSSWWPQINPVCSTTINMSYASGIEYQACPVSQSLYFKASSASIGGNDLTDALIELAPIDIAQIQSASGGDIQNWQDNVNKGVAPLYSNFYGDFGVVIAQADAIRSISSVLTQAKVASVNNQAIDSFPIGNAYIIDVGPYPGENSKSLSPGSLKMGLLPEPTQSPPWTSSWSNFQLNNDEGAVPQCTVTLKNDGGTTVYTSDPISVLFDTGTPTTHLWTGTQLSQETLALYSKDNVINPGMTFEVTASDGTTLMSFKTGADSGKNLVKFSPGGKGSTTYKGLVNTGLQPFFGNQVMFDFSQQGQSYLRIKANS